MNIHIAYYQNGDQVTIISAYEDPAEARRACEQAAREWGIGQIVWGRDRATRGEIASTKHVTFRIVPRILNGVSQ